MFNLSRRNIVTAAIDYKQNVVILRLLELLCFFTAASSFRNIEQEHFCVFSNKKNQSSADFVFNNLVGLDMSFILIGLAVGT